MRSSLTEKKNAKHLSEQSFIANYQTVVALGLDVNLEYWDLENGIRASPIIMHPPPTHPNEIRDASKLIRDTCFRDSRKLYSRLIALNGLGTSLVLESRGKIPLVDERWTFERMGPVQLTPVNNIG